MGTAQPTPERRQGEAHLLAALCLLAALGLRLWLAPTRGHVHDIAQFKAWAEAATSQGALAVYGASTANYPPLAVLALTGMAALHGMLWSQAGSASATLTAMLKLPAIGADLLTAVLIFRLVGARHGRKAALACLAAYSLNPAIWYTSAWWGQLEALYALPMLLAVSALDAGRPARAWAWLAVGMLVKPQAASIVPVLIVSSWRSGRWRAVAQGVAAAGLVMLVVLAPWAGAGQLPALWAQLRASAGQQQFLTMNAHNLWYLVTLGKGSFAARGRQHLMDSVPLIGPVTGWQIGLILLAGWCVWICWRLGREPAGGGAGRWYWPAAGLAAGFFMLPAESHERYLFAVLPLLAPLLPTVRPARWLYLAFSAGLLLNLLWVDPAVPLPGFAGQLPWGVPVALLNTSAMAYLAMSWAQASTGDGSTPV